MFQEFNTDTIESRFIKNLIYNTPLPIYRSVQRGDWITNTCSYIYKRNVIRCTKSGVFKGSSSSRASYDTVSDFNFGRYYPTFTERYSSHNNYYDYKTHEMLGTYLRCYRDLYGVDLMPFYNCFSGHYTNAFYIRDGKIVTGVSSLYKVALIPIKFNTEYTICVDCNDETTFAPLVLNNEIPIVTVYNGSLEDLSKYVTPQARTISGLSFKFPFKYRVDITQFADALQIPLQRNEKHLYLAVQLPASNNSSILVQEGDYTKLETNKIIDPEVISAMSDKLINNIYLSPLSLMYFNDGNSYAFSDRLIEYLLLNAVTSQETIDNNIKLFDFWDDLYNSSDYGVWHDGIRYHAYDYYKNNYEKDLRLRFIDINGFIDKDVERLLLKG